MALVVTVILGAQWLAYIPNAPSRNHGTDASASYVAIENKGQRIVGWIIEHPDTFFAGVVAAFTAVLAVSTSLLWLATLRHASHAEGAIKVSEQTAERQLRAYVSLSGFEALIGRYENMVTEWTIYPVWENAGQTPTRNARNQISWSVYAKDDGPDQIDFRDYAEVPDYPIVNVPPRSKIRAESAIIPVDTIWMTRGIQGRIFIWGWIEYDDLFAPLTPRRRTEFCSYLEWLGTPEEQAIAPRVYGRFNGADDDCYRKPAPRPNQGTN
jgi:hypothetical protein